MVVNNYDTITLYDTMIVNNYDTITLYDTITNTITDTIIQIVYDTSLPCAKIYTYIYATLDSNGYYTDFGFNVNEPGTYIDTLLTEDGCDSIVTLHLSSLVGIDEAETSQITMYPNPTNEKVYLSLNNVPNATITIRDIQGKVVRQHKVLPNETNVVLNVRDLASGTYTIMINNDKTRLTKKLIKR